MTDLEKTSSKREAGRDGDADLTQRLSNLLEERGVGGNQSLGAVFSYPDLKVAFVNAIGQQILSPVFEGGEVTKEFCLEDIISLSAKRLYDSQVHPMLQVTGSWSGCLILRDLWGGDIVAEVMFWRSSSSDGLDGHFVFMRAGPMSHATFRTTMGWKERELLLALLGHTKDAVYFKDRESRFLRASDNLIKSFGLKYPHEVIGKTDFHFFEMSHAAEAYEDEQQIIRTGEPILDKEEKETWEGGRVTWVSTSKMPLFDSGGNIVGTFGISRDITQRKAEEKASEELKLRLQLSQRLEAIGSLAAGVAHEINTPTQFVSDNVKFLGDAFGDLDKVLSACMKLVEKSAGIQELDEERAAVLDSIESSELEFLQEEIPQTLEQTLEGLGQIANIVGSMKEFSYPSAPEKSKADLNHAIENTLNVSRNEWKGVAEIDLDLDPELPEVSCMVDQVNQVVLNLIVNAAHAIADTEGRQGRIAVKTRVEAKHVCIEVRDTGIGMSESVRSRIFEPFFTTKGVGKGTGQGLAMVRNIVVNTHGGHIDCESEQGSGTVFRVYLPVGD